MQAVAADFDMFNGIERCLVRHIGGCEAARTS